MNFLTNWKINIDKLPAYADLRGTFTEHIDKKICNIILKSDNEKIVDEMKNEFKKMVDCIDSNNQLQVKYNPRFQLGRRYPDCPKETYPNGNINPDYGKIYSALISQPRIIKNTIFSYQDWIDIDQKKGHATILYELAHQNRMENEFPSYKEYLTEGNFEKIVAELSAYYSVENELSLDKKDIKWLFNKTIYGGGHKKWATDIITGKFKDDKGDEVCTRFPKQMRNVDNPHPFYISFKKETTKMIDLIFLNNSSIKEKVCKNLTEDELWRQKNRVMSYFCQIIENDITYHAYKYLVKNELIKAKHVDWGYDGITFKNPHTPFINELNSYVAKKTGFVNVCFVEKPFDDVLYDIIEERKAYIDSQDLDTDPIYIQDNNKEDNLDNAVNITIINTQGDTDVDIAKVLTIMSAGNYVCTDTKIGVWYFFNGSRWILDSGLSIRNMISNEVFDYYQKIYTKKLNFIREFEEKEKGNMTEKKTEFLDGIRKVLHSIHRISITLKTTFVKNNILKEASFMLYDVDFLKKLDTKHYLFAFKNCVFDLRTGEKKIASKDDYVFMHTDYDYDDTYNPTIIEELQCILNTILNDVSIRDYYLQALATGMSGHQVQNIFISTGKGGNGKSVLSSLMMDMVGKYGYKLPKMTLQTDVDTNSACPAIANMHNKRYVLSQEPKSDKKLNASTIKELTGDTAINARQLYSGNTDVIIKMSLFLECNDLPFIDETGDAITRRFRVIPFKTSAITQSSFDLLPIEEQQSGKYIIQNPFYATPDFRIKYKQALFHILLPKIMQFYANDLKMIEIPLECEKKARDYLATSDDIYSWFILCYEPLSVEEFNTDKDEPISIKDLYSIFKNSQAFLTMSKLEKRKHNQANFYEKIENNACFKKFFYLRNTYYRKKQIKCEYIVGWKMIEEE